MSALFSRVPQALAQCLAHNSAPYVFVAGKNDDGGGVPTQHFLRAWRFRRCHSTIVCSQSQAVKVASIRERAVYAADPVGGSGAAVREERAQQGAALTPAGGWH